MGKIDLHFWNLCNFGISWLSVLPFVEKGLTLESFLDDYSEKILVIKRHKPKLFGEISEILKNKKNTITLFSEYSTYALLSFDLSIGIVERMISDGVNLNEIEDVNSFDFKNRFGYIDSTINKILSSYHSMQKAIQRGEVHVWDENAEEIVTVREENALGLVRKIIYEDNPITNFRLRQRISEETKGKNFNSDINDLIMQLLNNDQIMVSSEGYIPFIVDLETYIESILDFKVKQMLEKKINGATLEEIGNEFGVSRERIRQILLKTTQNRPQIKEDRFKIYYSKYDFSEQEFCSIFNVTSKVYQLFKIEINHGTKSVNDFINEEGISEEQKFRVKSLTLKENEIIVMGRVLSLNVSGMVDYLLGAWKPNKTRFESFYKSYNKFIFDNLPNYQTKLIVDIRTFTNTLTKSKFTILCNDNSIKYFDWSKYDFEKLKEHLDLLGFENCVISSKILLSQIAQNLKDYNIADQYELHSVLRNVYQDETNIKFLRMPMIQIGETTKDEFVKNKLYEHSPIRTNEFAKMFSDLYGYEEASFKSYLQTTFRKYIQDDLIDIFAKFLDEDQAEKIKQLIPAEFILKKNLKLLMDEYFDCDSSSYLNNNNYELLSLRVYSSYLISDKYGSADVFFKTYILTPERFSYIKYISNDFKISNTFGSIFNQMLAQLEIIEYEPNEYINIRKLKTIGIDKQDIKNHVSKALSYVDRKEYFTLKKLYLRGYKSELEETGFGDFFITNLIIYAGNLNYRKIGSTTLFYFEGGYVSIPDFLESFFVCRTRFDLYDFSILLEEDYGIFMDYGRLKEQIGYTKLYYADDLDIVYINKEEYLKEVFQDDNEFTL